MRNVDRIKALEHELGRYRKKVADQQKELDRLNEQVRTQAEGADQVGILVDAILAATASRYGTVVEHDDGNVIGFRLELADFELERMRKRWKVSAQRRGSSYVVGVMEREDRETNEESEPGGKREVPGVADR